MITTTRVSEIVALTGNEIACGSRTTVSVIKTGNGIVDAKAIVCGIAPATAAATATATVAVAAAHTRSARKPPPERERRGEK